MNEEDTLGPQLALELQHRMVSLVRAFGLHQPDRTPCGQPIAVTEAHALIELNQQAPLSQHELARRLRLEKSTVSRLVAQMRARGWVECSRDRADRRIVHVLLSETGREIAAQVDDARRAKFDQLFAAMSSNERNEVLHALSILVEALNSRD